MYSISKPIESQEVLSVAHALAVYGPFRAGNSLGIQGMQSYTPYAYSVRKLQLPPQLWERQST